MLFVTDPLTFSSHGCDGGIARPPAPPPSSNPGRTTFRER
jgi:hypothetical protein